MQSHNVLHIAAKNGYFDIVEYILSFSVDINATNVSGDTALTLAAQGGHLDIIKTVFTLLIIS